MSKKLGEGRIVRVWEESFLYLFTKGISVGSKNVIGADFIVLYNTEIFEKDMYLVRLVGLMGLLGFVRLVAR